MGLSSDVSTEVGFILITVIFLKVMFLNVLWTVLMSWEVNKLLPKLSSLQQGTEVKLVQLTC